MPKLGRPSLPARQRRVTITTPVSWETHRALNAEAKSSRKGKGWIIDGWREKAMSASVNGGAK